MRGGPMLSTHLPPMRTCLDFERENHKIKNNNNRTFKNPKGGGRQANLE